TRLTVGNSVAAERALRAFMKSRRRTSGAPLCIAATKRSITAPGSFSGHAVYSRVVDRTHAWSHQVGNPDRSYLHEACPHTRQNTMVVTQRWYHSLVQRSRFSSRFLRGVTISSGAGQTSEDGLG